jgi:hypothetical protein
MTTKAAATSPVSHACTRSHNDSAVRWQRHARDDRPTAPGAGSGRQSALRRKPRRRARQGAATAGEPRSKGRWSGNSAINLCQVADVWPTPTDLDGSSRRSNGQTGRGRRPITTCGSVS